MQIGSLTIEKHRSLPVARYHRTPAMQTLEHINSVKRLPAFRLSKIIVGNPKEHCHSLIMSHVLVSLKCEVNPPTTSRAQPIQPILEKACKHNSWYEQILSLFYFVGYSSYLLPHSIAFYRGGSYHGSTTLYFAIQTQKCRIRILHMPR